MRFSTTNCWPKAWLKRCAKIRVIVSDDLGVAAAVSQVASAQRGVTFLAAGGDLVIDADPSTAASMVKTAIDRAKSDKAFAQSVTDKATRVLTMKQSVNLVTCE